MSVVLGEITDSDAESTESESWDENVNMPHGLDMRTKLERACIEPEFINRILGITAIENCTAGGRTESNEPVVAANDVELVVLSEDEVEITDIISNTPKRNVLGSPIELDSDDSGEEQSVEINSGQVHDNTTANSGILGDRTAQDQASTPDQIPAHEQALTYDQMSTQGQASTYDQMSTQGQASTQGQPSTQDPTCPICLGEFDNKAFLDQCFHAFCFYCILQWSEVVKTCPLCKATFSSLIHSVKSMVEFEQHHLPETAVPPLYNQEGQRFRYRTTVADGRHRDQVQARGRTHPSDAWEQRSQRRQLFISSRRQKAVMAKEKRRSIYANSLWVQQVTQQGKPKFREISPGFFRANPACVHRLVPWLSRELMVLLNDDQSSVDFIMQLIMTLITRIAIESDEFAEQLQPFLHDKAHQFGHEFATFARAPFDMAAYDEHAQYNWPSVQMPQETPVVFHSSATGWDTPDVTAGPSGISPLPSSSGSSGISSLPGPSGLSSSANTCSWDDDVDTNYHGNSSWSPVATQDTERPAPLTPQVIEVRSLSMESVETQESAHGDNLGHSTSAGNDITVVTLSDTSATPLDAKTRRRRKRRNKQMHKRKQQKQSLSTKQQSHPNPIISTESPQADNNLSPRTLRSRTISRERSRSISQSSVTGTQTISRERSRSRSPSRFTGSQNISRERSRSRSRTRVTRSRTQSLSCPPHTSSPTPSQKKRQKKLRKWRPRRKAKLQSCPAMADEVGSSVAHAPSSPTEEDMRREITELEVRIAVDSKRLLELMKRQEERAASRGTGASNGSIGHETDE